MIALPYMKKKMAFHYLSFSLTVLYSMQEGTTYDGRSEVQTIIMRQLGNQFRNNQFKLHKVFLSYDSKDEALKNVPEGVKEEEWISLCNKFTDPKWLVCKYKFIPFLFKNIMLANIEV